ncbi:MAG: carbamoyl phosphate synthase small subunit [Firmicutes bacterium]|nr:carbamoyl phosphate synthase small subunit [Bacillota bacterium]
MKKAYLILENGQVFTGRLIGAGGTALGELVFTTGMEGYLETLSDPSYAGQIIMQTFPLIGNYGVIPEDFEGKPAARGYVVRELCSSPSNFRSESDLETFLREQHITGICGVDTREITRILRESGVMNAMIADHIPEDLSAIQAYKVADVVSAVSCRKVQSYPASSLPAGRRPYRVTLIDYGNKRGIIRSLRKLGCDVTVVPHDTPAEAILGGRPDGIMLSNGPGDPAENTLCIEHLKGLLGKLPVFGICLGHQLMALAMGGRTIKLKYGHRGANQPVTLVGTHRTLITSQNHGYAVVAESLAGIGKELYVHANDGSCEGMEYPDANCFSVQFHPEACAGPRDAEFIFERFISMMGD